MGSYVRTPLPVKVRTVLVSSDERFLHAFSSYRTRYSQQDSMESITQKRDHEFWSHAVARNTSE